MKNMWLGSSRLWWCLECNLPLASESCSLCGSAGAKIEITPPFDPRPAFGWDIEQINRACLEQFGCLLLNGPGVPVVMNRLPSPDRAEEVVVFGTIVARIFFDGMTGTAKMKPTAKGAALLLSGRLKNRLVKIEDSTAKFLEGGDLLAPGVVDADVQIRKEDWVVIESPGFVAVGIAKMSGPEMVESERGKAVKVKGISPKVPETKFRSYTGGEWREAAVRANSGHISRIEEEAVSFIRSFPCGPKAVSFSGGKDSLAVLLLAERALGPDGFKVMFIDTGLEFPETLEYVNSLGSSTKVVREGAGDAFWKALEKMGPPARDRRWCCKVCKLAPARRLIDQEFPDGCLSLMGERRYESLERARRPRVDVNPWIPRQVHAYPILGWTAFDVWLYIFSKKAAYNSLYEKGFTRIGCWLCPACDLYDFTIVEKLHPGLWGKWKLHARPGAKSGACSGV